MRLNFNDGLNTGSVYNCLYQEKLSRSVERSFTKYSKSDVNSLYTLKTDETEIQTSITNAKKYYATYIAKYPSALHLRQQLKTPRACAYQSATLDPIEYYRGEKPWEVYIRDRTPYAYILTSILSGGGHYEILNSRPTEAPISTFDPQSGLWSV